MLLAKYKKRYPLEVQITWFCFWNGINTLEFSVLRFLGSLSIKWNVPLAMVCESVCRCVHRNGKVGGKEDISCHWNMHMHALLGHLPRMLYLIFGQTLCMYTSLLLSVASDFSLSLHNSSTAMRSLLKHHRSILDTIISKWWRQTNTQEYTCTWADRNTKTIRTGDFRSIEGWKKQARSAREIPLPR